MKHFINRFSQLSLITFILLGLVVLAACNGGYGPPITVPAPAPVPPAPSPAPQPAPAPAPTIQITSPSGSVQAGDITVSVQVSNFTITDALGKANVAGEGHIHYFLDVDAATTPDKPAVTAPGTYAATAGSSYTWKNVTAGTHTFSAELINNDHTPLVPPITTKVTVTVLAAPSVSTPTPAPTPAPTPTPTPVPTPAATPASPQYTVNVTSKPSIGTYLVDGKGMTLYYTTLDATGRSNITGANLVTWPIFNSSTTVIPASLTASDFSSITRSDGAKQTTYKGWPLYYYVLDKAAGDSNGNGVEGVWFVINPTSITTAPASPAAGGGGNGGGGGGSYGY